MTHIFTLDFELCALKRKKRDHVDKKKKDISSIQKKILTYM